MGLVGNSPWLQYLHKREKKEGWGPHDFGVVRNHVALAKVGTARLGCSLLPRGLGSRGDLAGKKRGERTLADGP